MSWRRVAALAAFTLLLFALVRRTTSEDLRGRAAIIRRAFSLSAAERRAAGGATAYDRAFFPVLERARRELPVDARGVALYAPTLPEWGGLYYAVYHLAPVPVAIAPEEVPPGWVALAYRAPGPAGLRVLREWPGGALLVPR
ncbi:MAG: hypothetical protein ABR576_15320 [Thermoanaerobaculia bacterium]